MLPSGSNILFIFFVRSFFFSPTSTLEHQSTSNKEEREGEEAFFASNSTSKNQMFDLLLTKFSSPSSKAFDSSKMRDSLPPSSTYSLLAGDVPANHPLLCPQPDHPHVHVSVAQTLSSTTTVPSSANVSTPSITLSSSPLQVFCASMPSCPIPPPLPVPRPPQILMPQNDCCCNCQGGCRVKYANLGAFKARGTRIRGFGENSNARCNSAALQRIIVESISEEIDTSKRIIQQKAQETYDSKSFNVVCGKGNFLLWFTLNCFAKKACREVLNE
uniref:Ground-like domain-containing protein n=1 Tax=Ditylenchus dipsaci TaxID=166011 RepID=A0A915DAM4_9BILA